MFLENNRLFFSLRHTYLYWLVWNPVEQITRVSKPCPVFLILPGLLCILEKKEKFFLAEKSVRMRKIGGKIEQVKKNLFYFFCSFGFGNEWHCKLKCYEANHGSIILLIFNRWDICNFTFYQIFLKRSSITV